MTSIVTIQAIPNQSFTVYLDGNNWNFTIQATNGVMSVTVLLNNTLIISGARVVAGTPILPYLYLENGNFIFLTQNGDLPDYTQFNITQFLYYYSIAELEAAGW